VGDGDPFELDATIGVCCAESSAAQTNANKNGRQIAHKPFLESGIANSVRKPGNHQSIGRWQVGRVTLCAPIF
jgi:hypothetical protein